MNKLRTLFFKFLPAGLSLLLFACTSVSPDRQPTSSLGVAEGTEHQPVETLRVVTRQAGVYRQPLADLARYGYEPARLAQGDFRLVYRGQTWPAWVSAEGNLPSLVFYAPPTDSLYTLENVFFLESQEKPLELAIAPPPGTALSTPFSTSDSYTHVLHLEQNLLYRPQVEMGEAWLWELLAGPASLELELPTSQLVEGPAVLRLELWAASQAPVDPDHHLILRLNDQLLLDTTFDGPGRKSFEVSLPVSLLNGATDRLVIELPGDTGAVADMLALDWVELSYRRAPVAEADHLIITGEGLAVIPQGFSGAYDLFQVSKSQDPAWLGQGLDASQAVGLSAGEDYHLVGPQGYQQPLRLEPAWQSPDLLQEAVSAAYLVIAPALFRDELAPLVDLRRDQGLPARFIPLEAVYDQFSAGMPEPQGLRRFLAQVASQGEATLRYVLLVGDATYDPRGYLAEPTGNLLPTFLIPTRYGGQTGSDFGYAVLQGDAWPVTPAGEADLEPPKLAVGRIPARTPGQLRAWIQKLSAYESSLSDPSAAEKLRQVLLVTDRQAETFQVQAERFGASLAPGFTTLQVPMQDDAALGRQEVLAALQQGAGLVAYFGHGTVTGWGQAQYLSVKDLPVLPASPAIMLHMTCLAGLFTHPSVLSLSEALLWQETGGAIALLAPTSLTLPFNQDVLAQGMAAHLTDGHSPRLGDAFLSAQLSQELSDVDQRDVAYTFVLLGDPAMRLFIP